MKFPLPAVSAVSPGSWTFPHVAPPFFEKYAHPVPSLNPYIGYDKATEIVKSAAASGRSLRETAREAGVDDAVLDEALDYHAMAKPHG